MWTSHDRTLRGGTRLASCAALVLMTGALGCFPPVYYHQPQPVTVTYAVAPAPVTAVVTPREITPGGPNAPAAPQAAAPQTAAPQTPAPWAVPQPPPVAAGEPALEAPAPIGVRIEVAVNESGDPQQELDRALRLMAEGEDAAAAELLEPLAAREPTSVALFNLAVCHDRLGNQQQAIATYRLLTDDADFGPYAGARLAHLRDQAADGPGEAQQQEARALFVQGMELFEAGRFQEAIEVFQSAYDLVHHPRILFNLAVCYHRLGQTSRAATYYGFVLREEGSEPEARDRARAALDQLIGAGDGGGEPE